MAIPATCVPLDFALGPTTEMVLAGERDAADTKELLDVLRAAYLPEAVLLLRPAGKEGENITKLIPCTAAHCSFDSRATVYLCQNFSCSAPLTDPAELRHGWKARTTSDLPLNHQAVLAC